MSKCQRCGRMFPSEGPAKVCDLCVEEADRGRLMDEEESMTDAKLPPCPICKARIGSTDGDPDRFHPRRIIIRCVGEDPHDFIMTEREYRALCTRLKAGDEARATIEFLDGEIEETEHPAGVEKINKMIRLLRPLSLETIAMMILDCDDALVALTQQTGEETI